MTAQPSTNKNNRLIEALAKVKNKFPADKMDKFYSDDQLAEFITSLDEEQIKKMLQIIFIAVIGSRLESSNLPQQKT